MAVKNYSVRECDVHADGTLAVTARSFSIQGREFTVDLCSRDAKLFDAEMDAWVGRAVSTGGREQPAPVFDGPVVDGAPTAKPAPTPSARSSRPARKTRRKKTPAATTDPALIREWATRAGMEVAPVGRISTRVRDAYHAAMKPSETVDAPVAGKNPAKKTASKKTAKKSPTTAAV